MKEDEIKQKLTEHARNISEEFNEAPVVVIVAGLEKAGISRCMAGWANVAQGQNREGRLRDRLGILQTMIQFEFIEHLPQ